MNVKKVKIVRQILSLETISQVKEEHLQSVPNSRQIIEIPTMIRVITVQSKNNTIMKL